MRLVAHKVFTPTPGDPIDFETTIEKTLREWHARFPAAGRFCSIRYQMAAVSQRLARERYADRGISADGSQPDGCHQQFVRPDQARQLVLYPDAGMRLAISHAIIIESSRGWRLDKLKQQHKIDVVVALSMAALAAVRDGGKSRYDSSLRWVCDDDEIIAT